MHETHVSKQHLLRLSVPLFALQRLSVVLSPRPVLQVQLAECICDPSLHQFGLDVRCLLLSKSTLCPVGLSSALP